MKIPLSKLRTEFEGLHHIIKTSDDKKLFLRAWEAKTTPKKIAVLILHGITAHSGPYEVLAGPLTQNGYSVFGLDLRGHGLSDGTRGDYPGRDRLVKDLCETITFVKQSFPNVILLGHSLGVLSAFFAISSCLEAVDGLVLLSAARTFKPGAYPKISLFNKLTILLNSIIWPSKPVINYFREGMQGTDDPLFNFKYTFRFMKIFSAKNLTLPEDLNFPIFIGIGEHDELFTVEAGRELFDEIPGENKEFYVAPGAKHAEFPDGSWNRLVSWLTENFE